VVTTYHRNLNLTLSMWTSWTDSSIVCASTPLDVLHPDPPWFPKHTSKLP
jgi:hypothetical protein